LDVVEGNLDAVGGTVVFETVVVGFIAEWVVVDLFTTCAETWVLTVADDVIRGLDEVVGWDFKDKTGSFEVVPSDFEIEERSLEVVLGVVLGVVVVWFITGRVVVAFFVILEAVFADARETRRFYGSASQIGGNEIDGMFRLTCTLPPTSSTGAAKTERERASAMRPATRIARVG
jgi:hypothetical protein